MSARVLFVTFNRLSPADQGNARRAMQMARLYKALGLEVDLLYHCDEGFDPALSHTLSQIFGTVRVVAPRVSKRVYKPEHLCHIADWYDPQLDAACREMHALRAYQVVHVNYIWYTPLFKQFGPEVAKVLDTHDIFGDRAQKYRQAGLEPHWFSTTIGQEDSALQRADVALAIQKEEAAELAARGHRNILSLPYIEPCVRPFQVSQAHRPLTFGYLGSGNDWNVRSMQAFTARLRQVGSQFTHPMVVAGGICKHIPDTPGLIKLGFVKELHTFYDAIDIAINPMVGGTGLKIKTVEPLSYGKPVLTTPSGAQGLSHLWQLPIVADPQTMVSYLLEHFRTPNPALVQTLVDQAQASQQAFEAEYLAQVERFKRWLNSRLR